MAADSFPSWTDAVPAAVEVWSEGDRTVIGLYGEHDAETEPELSDALGRFCSAGRLGDVVVDLSEATFVDSATIAALLGARNLMAHQGRSLVLRAPSRRALRVLEMCGLLRFVEPVTAGLGYRHPGVHASSDGHDVARLRSPRPNGAASPPPPAPG
jgi:anti-sigma B factor antagonist